MNDAPEKIWAWARHGDWRSGGHCTAEQSWANEGDTPYRRTDLPATRAQIAASPEVRALVDVLERVIADPHWRTTDNTLWPDMCKAVAAFKAMERANE